MTSKFTREQLIEKLKHRIAVTEKYPHLEEAQIDSQIFKIALAAMDSEPVAWVVGSDEIAEFNRGREVMVMRDCDDEELENLPLYRHAQQPVVPPMQHWEELCREYPDMSIGDAIIRAAWWNHCRAAMLQTGTLTNEDTRQVDELTMWVKRLVRSLKKASPDSKLHSEAMDYLTTKGLISVGDALR